MWIVSRRLINSIYVYYMKEYYKDILYSVLAILLYILSGALLVWGAIYAYVLLASTIFGE